MDAFLRAYNKKYNFTKYNRICTCFDVIGVSTVMLLVDFDPKRRLWVQSLMIFARNRSLNPDNDLNSLLSNRLFGFKFDKSKIEIANDLPTFTKV